MIHMMVELVVMIAMMGMNMMMVCMHVVSRDAMSRTTML